MIVQKVSSVMASEYGYYKKDGKDQLCRILSQSERLNEALIKFPDGHTETVPLDALKKKSGKF